MGGIRMVAAALALSAATCLSAFASSTSVTIADGASLTVWEQHGCALAGRGRESSSLKYSLTDAAGTHLGVVPTTADAARDTGPTSRSTKPARPSWYGAVSTGPTARS